jgi:hypothetical protein
MPAWDSLTGSSSPRWWARKALTNDGESEDPNLVDDKLDPLLEDADADLQGRYPCVGATPWASLAGNELLSWAKAVGMSAACTELSGAQGAVWAKVITEVKIGTVTEKSSLSAISPADLVAGVEKQAGAALSRIACIRTGRAAKNAGKLYSTAGRRQSIGSYPTIQGKILGLKENGTLPD